MVASFVDLSSGREEALPRVMSICANDCVVINSLLTWLGPKTHDTINSFIITHA